MSRLIESIRLCDGEFSRLNLHQDRINKAFRKLFNSKPDWNLKQILISSNILVPSTGLFKCRVVYDEVDFKIEFQPYEMKSIKSLKLVESDLEYSHKYEDRTIINNLFNLRESCDDILIVKDNCITDTSFANIVFQKNNQWFTPDLPLLEGTMRKFLLDSSVISLTSIRKKDVLNFESFKLINSMLEWNAPSVEISKIIMK